MGTRSFIGFWLGIFLLSGHAYASTDATPFNWSDLNPGDTYLLAEPLQLAPSFALAATESLTFIEDLPLDDVAVQAFRFKLLECDATRSTLQTEMVLLRNQYGLELEKPCVLEVFLENKDLGQKSFFNPNESRK